MLELLKYITTAKKPSRIVNNLEEPIIMSVEAYRELQKDYDQLFEKEFKKSLSDLILPLKSEYTLEVELLHYLSDKSDWTYKTYGQGRSRINLGFGIYKGKDKPWWEHEWRSGFGLLELNGIKEDKNLIFGYRESLDAEDRKDELCGLDKFLYPPGKRDKITMIKHVKSTISNLVDELLKAARKRGAILATGWNKTVILSEFKYL